VNLTLRCLTIPFSQYHNVDDQLNEGLPLGIFLDEFSMIPPDMLGQVKMHIYSPLYLCHPFSPTLQALRRIQQLHNNMGKLPLPSLFLLSGDPYQVLDELSTHLIYIHGSLA
jgi:hypothetical protein